MKKGLIVMGMIENFINYKIGTITSEQLFKYAQQFNFDVTEQQADRVAKYLRSERVNIFNDSDRTELVKKIAVEVDPQTARKLNQLFLQFQNFTS